MLLEVRFVFHAIFGCVPCDVRCVFLAICGVRSLRCAVCVPCDVRYVILAMCGVADTDIDIHTEAWV